MDSGFAIFFAVGALMPGFFVFHFFKDALEEYKASGKYFWETLLSSPGLFFLCLGACLALLTMAVLVALGVL